MMLRQHISVLLISVILLQSAGCTIIGASVGAVQDVEHPRMKDSRFENIHTLKHGKKITLNLVSGTKVTGEFIGFSHIDEKEFLRLVLAEYRDSLRAVNFPILEKPVTLTRVSGHSFQAYISGITYDSLYFRMSDNTTTYALEMNEIRCIEGAGSIDTTLLRRVEPAELRILILKQIVPVSTALNVKTEQGIMQAPFHQVENLKIGRFRYTGLIVGIAVGAALDYLVYLAIVALALASAGGAFGSMGE